MAFPDALRRAGALPRQTIQLASERRGRSDRIGADAGFAACQLVAGAIERFVCCVVAFAKGAEGLFAGPAVDSEVGAGDVGVAQQLRAPVVGRGAEQLRPCALGRIGGLKGGDLLLGNLELPDNDEHTRPQSSLMVAQRGLRWRCRARIPIPGAGWGRPFSR